MPSDRGRAWSWTLNNYTDDEFNQLKEMYDKDNSIRYLCFGVEVGESGTSHLQGYIVFKNARVFNSVKKMLPRAHLEKSKGDANSNVVYCSKDGDFLEWGDRPISAKRKGEAEKERWVAIVNDAKEGNIDELSDREPKVFLQYYSTLKKIAIQYGQLPPDLTDPCGVWIWGPPGVGKSFKARADYPGAYYKPCNKWWDGYQGQENVIMDDFDKVHHVLGHHLKIWSDAYAFLMEIKGGSWTARPMNIVITSNYHPDEIWTDPSLLSAIIRRFKIIHIADKLY